MKFILSWIALAVGVAASIVLVPGITPVGSDSTIAIIVMALSLALVNVAVKPVAQALSLPLTVITLGLFYVVMNALLLELAAWLSAGFFGSGVQIDGFLSAFFGSIVISIVSGIVNAITGNKD